MNGNQRTIFCGVAVVGAGVAGWLLGRYMGQKSVTENTGMVGALGDGLEGGCAPPPVLSTREVMAGMGVSGLPTAPLKWRYLNA